MSDNLTDKQLKLGYWWILHRATFHRLAVVIIGVIALSFCGYALWQLTDWLTSRQAEEDALRQLVSQNINVDDYRRSSRPVPLEIKLTTAVPSAKNLYDLVAEVKNPNMKWAITNLSFTFTADGVNSQGHAFFLPMEEKYLIKLGVPLQTKPQKIEVTFDGIEWQRIRDLSELNIPSFEISEQEIEHLIPNDYNSPTATKLTFKLNNKNNDSYWQVNLTAILSRFGSIQAVAQKSIVNVISQSQRVVEFYWPNMVISADSVIIKPEVNVLDPRTIK